MEQLNRMEVIGRIGNASQYKHGESRCVRFSVATDFVYRGREGTPVIETTWHNAVVWEGRNMPDPELISRGRCVHLVGRVRQRHYETADGQERAISEIYVSELSLIDEQITAQCNF